MAGVTGAPVLRVTARQPKRYRAGFRFGPEPRVLTADEFGDDDAEAFRKVAAICTDHILKVEKPVGGEVGNPDWEDFTDEDVSVLAKRLADLEADTKGAAGASASSGADVTIPEQDGGGADNQPSTAAPSAPVAADQNVAANVPEPVAPPHDVPEPTTTQFPKATPSGRKAKAKPATAD